MRRESMPRIAVMDVEMTISSLVARLSETTYSRCHQFPSRSVQSTSQWPMAINVVVLVVLVPGLVVVFRFSIH